MSLFAQNALILALGTAAACSPDLADAESLVQPTVESTATPRVDASLSKLRALKIFEVGELIVKNPSELTSCYGIPCPGSEAARQAQRLGKLAAKAETAATKSAPAKSCEAAQIDANLAALRALKILKVGDLVREKPANNPSCYNLPCEEDIAKAKAVTCEHAGTLAHLATDAKGL